MADYPDIEVDDGDLYWGFRIAETGLRITGLSVQSRVKHEEDVDDHVGNVVGYGASGHVTTASVSGMIRAAGPGWSLATACTIANAAKLSGFGGPTITTVVCNGLSRDCKNNGRMTGKYDFRLLDFS